MARILQFKVRGKKVKQKKDNMVSDFLETLDGIRELFLIGEIDKVIIIATGKDLKCCSSNRLMVSDADEMFRDFLRNPKQYID